MKNVLVGLLVAIGLLLTAGCGKNKDLKLAQEKAKNGEYKEAIELYTGITMHQKNVGILDEARTALADIYFKMKNYEGALKALEELSKEHQAKPAVQELLKTVTAENNIIEGIKSASVQYRMQYVKEKEIRHEVMDYTAPIYSGTADLLFSQAQTKAPAASDLTKFRIEVKLTDDPLEPTKLKITYPDGSVKELALNY